MPSENRTERRVAGVKAKHLMQKGEMGGSASHAGRVPIPTILIISPIHRRVRAVLEEILKRGGKHMACVGVELYRHALARLESDLKDQIVALIITDKPDDCYAPSRGDYPLWKETIAMSQQSYTEAWPDEIKFELFPANLTVITVFRSHKGQLNENDIQLIEQEFQDLKETILVDIKPCSSDSELQTVVDKDVIGMVLERQQQKDKMRSWTRSRDQKIQKAKKLTKDARRKM